LYWFCHEYLAALAERRITSIDDAPVKAPGIDMSDKDFIDTKKSIPTLKFVDIL